MEGKSQFAPLNEEIAQDVADRYDGEIGKANPEEVARAYGASEHFEFYRDINENDPELWNELTSNLQNQAGLNDSIAGVKPVASDGGTDGELESRATAVYDKVRSFVDEHPKASRIGGAGLLLGALGTGFYAATNQDSGPQTSYDDNNTTEDDPTTTPGGPDDDSEEPGMGFDEINRTLSAANMSEELLVDTYFQGNLSEENTEDVYEVFDDELLNGSELSQTVTDDEGRIKEKYIKDEYRTNDSFKVFEPGTSISDILDREEILDDIENQSVNVSGLQGDITQAEDWYDGEYEEQIAEDIAEDQVNGTAENVTVRQENGNYTVNGTFFNEQGSFQQDINISEDVVETSKEDFSTVLRGLDTVRTLNASQSSNETFDYTQNFFSELEQGNFNTIQDARTIGQAYENSTANSTNVTEADVLGGYLEEKTTARELSYLNQALEQNSTDLVNMTDDPISHDWSGDGADNLALMDLGLDPFENHGVLDEYNISRNQTGENGENNTYTVTDDSGSFNSSVNTGQFRTFGPALQEVHEEYKDPEEADRAELLDEDITRRQQMSAITGFAFEYLDNESHTDTVTDMTQLAVIDERDTQDYGPGLSEKITYFETFDEAWADQDEAFQWARLMVDEENLDYADEAGLQLLDPVYRQAMEDGRFSWENDERLTEDRLEELEDEATDWNGDLQEPDIEPDEIDDLDDHGGFSTSSSSDDGGSDDGGGDDGGSDDGGGNPPNGGGGPGGR